MPIGIVAYAFTLLWDNLCRNRRRVALYSLSLIDRGLEIASDTIVDNATNSS